jgi:hypothetical protein
VPDARSNALNPLAALLPSPHRRCTYSPELYTAVTSTLCHVAAFAAWLAGYCALQLSVLRESHPA